MLDLGGGKTRRGRRHERKAGGDNESETLHEHPGKTHERFSSRLCVVSLIK